MKSNQHKQIVLLPAALFLAVFLFSGCDNNTNEQQENNTRYLEENANEKTFRGYECTDDCSGHKAGYNWAAKKDIVDSDNCGGKSTSFVEGCRAHVNEN